MVRIIFAHLVFLLLWAPITCGAEQLRVFTVSPYDRHIIFQALIFFWIGIIGLIIIILMKLKEIKRIQDMDIHKEDENAPFLD
ncbi:MAG: hypothetical protein ABFD12_11230 [Syntrophorhabdus sp.]